MTRGPQFMNSPRASLVLCEYPGCTLVIVPARTVTNSKRYCQALSRLVSFLALVAAPGLAMSQPLWTTVGSMATAREAHTARLPHRHDEPGLDRTWLYQGDGYQAKCRVIDGEYVVLEGSIARMREVPSLSKSSSAARKALVAANVLVERDGGLVFTQDYAFGSPSGAA